MAVTAAYSLSAERNRNRIRPRALHRATFGRCSGPYHRERITQLLTRSVAFLMLLTASTHASPPLVNGKWFGGDIGSYYSSGGVPNDYLAVFNMGFSNDPGLWYEIEPSEGTFSDWFPGGTTTIPVPPLYECPSVLWGYYDVPQNNEPSWMVNLPPAQQVNDYIGYLQYLETHLPKGSHVELIAEALHTNMSTVEQSLGGTGATGWDGLIKAIKLFRQYCPDLACVVMDFNLLWNDHLSWDGTATGTPETTRFINQINVLKANGAAPDFLADEGDFLDGATAEQITTSLNRIGALGIPIEVNNLDVENGAAGDDAAQLADMQRIFSAIWQNPYVIGIAVWDTWNGFGTGYPGHVNDNLYAGGNVATLVHRPALDWIISYIPTSNPPNAFAQPSPTPTPIPAPIPTPSAPVPSPAPAIAFVQQGYSTPQNSVATVTVPLSNAQAPGSANVVVVGWNDATHTVSGVTDANGNLYVLAAPAIQYPAGNISQAMYFSPNIKGGGNSVTVSFSGPVPYADVRIAEYSGVQNLAGTSSASGSSINPSSGSVNSSAPALLVSAVTTTGEVTVSGLGFNNRVITSPDGDLLQDEILTGKTGTLSDGATLGGTDYWVSQLVSFK